MDLLSVSQIETWEGCARKGAWKYIAKVETPQHPSAALGTEVDDEQLQPFLRDGRPFDFSRPSGEIAQSIVEFLPPAGSCGPGGIGEVQKHFEMPSPTWVDGKHCGLGLQGYLDLWLPNGGLPGIPPLEDGSVPPVVCDFKTAKTFKYAKDEFKLATDLQAQTYAMWAMCHTRKPVIDLVWLYARTEGARQGKRFHLRVHTPSVAKQFVSIDERARRVHLLKKSGIKDPLELPATTSHCGAYGGCPYQSRCNLGPGDQADAEAATAQRRRGDENMSNAAPATTGLLARMRAKRDASTGVAGPVAPLVAPVAVVGINPPEKELAPAPPVGTVVEKRGPGRPPKSVAATAGEKVRFVWGAEKISPVAYNTFDVGPFEAETTTRPGESVADALARLESEVDAFAQAVKERKAKSFAASLGAKGAA